MDVISRTAFGLDMGVQDVTNHMFVQHAATFFGIPRVHGLRATIQSAMLFLKSKWNQVKSLEKTSPEIINFHL